GCAPGVLVRGVAVGVVVSALLHLVCLCALGAAGLWRTSRVAEAATRALFGGGAARAMTAAVAVSAFGCLAATILYSSRIYQPMAADGVFFRRVAEIHPRWRTPAVALWLQSAGAAALTPSGSFPPLFPYRAFAPAP